MFAPAAGVEGDSDFGSTTSNSTPVVPFPHLLAVVFVLALGGYFYLNRGPGSFGASSSASLCNLSFSINTPRSLAHEMRIGSRQLRARHYRHVGCEITELCNCYEFGQEVSIELSLCSTSIAHPLSLLTNPKNPLPFAPSVLAAYQKSFNLSSASDNYLTSTF
ncbi:hypothetical protein K435DRAFT_798324 [Dendrothele bispora CBS 962.96]|uniref:Uncharacterized protein n=1 Tax=Dendrothele bispora (strain CBS 962.96) TaxID=1314807 RepID=A0A4S8M058_DENBC|nr:hypothetical protein K435DRAFT_798324 [Dendrothele bispora CBS 962.96]